MGSWILFAPLMIVQQAASEDWRSPQFSLENCSIIMHHISRGHANQSTENWSRGTYNTKFGGSIPDSAFPFIAEVQPPANAGVIHFVVLHRTETGFFVYDGASSVISHMGNETFFRQWTGGVYTLRETKSAAVLSFMAGLVSTLALILILRRDR